MKPSCSFTLCSVCSLWVRRYRAEAAAVVEGSREAYQNNVDRMAEIKRNENLCLLQEAKVKQLAARAITWCTTSLRVQGIP